VAVVLLLCRAAAVQACADQGERAGQWWWCCCYAMLLLCRHAEPGVSDSEPPTHGSLGRILAWLGRVQLMADRVCKCKAACIRSQGLD